MKSKLFYERRYALQDSMIFLVGQNQISTLCNDKLLCLFLTLFSNKSEVSVSLRAMYMLSICLYVCLSVWNLIDKWHPKIKKGPA